MNYRIHPSAMRCRLSDDEQSVSALRIDFCRNAWSQSTSFPRRNWIHGSKACDKFLDWWFSLCKSPCRSHVEVNMPKVQSRAAWRRGQNSFALSYINSSPCSLRTTILPPSAISIQHLTRIVLLYILLTATSSDKEDVISRSVTINAAEYNTTGTF